MYLHACQNDGVLNITDLLNVISKYKHNVL